MWCHYWWLNDPFCCVHHSRDFQCFLIGQTTPKIATSCGGSWPPSDAWFLGSSWISPQNGILISLAVFFLHNTLVWPIHIHTDRQTHRPCYVLKAEMTPVCWRTESRWGFTYLFFLSMKTPYRLHEAVILPDLLIWCYINHLLPYLFTSLRIEPFPGWRS